MNQNAYFTSWNTYFQNKLDKYDFTLQKIKYLFPKWIEFMNHISRFQKVYRGSNNLYFWAPAWRTERNILPKTDVLYTEGPKYSFTSPKGPTHSVLFLLDQSMTCRDPYVLPKNGIFYPGGTKNERFPSLRDRKYCFGHSRRDRKMVFASPERLTHSILSLLDQWMVYTVLVGPKPVCFYLYRPFGDKRERFQFLWDRKIIFGYEGPKYSVYRLPPQRD